MKPKIIYYEPAGKIHSSQWDLINYPPDGYEFVVGKSAIDRAVVGNSFIFDRLRLQVLDRLVPLNLAKARFDTVMSKVPPDTDLIYSYNHLIFRKIPWVVNVEWAHILVGRDLKYFRLCKGLVEKSLASDYCRKIFAWTEVAKKSMLLNYDCRGFEHKIEVMPPAIHSKQYVRDYDRGKVRLLFVGSLDDPQDFGMKGGFEVARVFLALRKKHPNMVLVIRAKVPDGIKLKLAHFDNVKIISTPLSNEAMIEEFEKADIFLHPSHKIQTTSVLEAMSYGLPVVTTEIGASCGEYVEDGMTGFVTPSSRQMPYFEGNFIITSETIHRGRLLLATEKIGKKVIAELAMKVSTLITLPSLREHMGKAAKWEIDYGKFSIRRRNLRLQQIFDEATI